MVEQNIYKSLTKKAAIKCQPNLNNLCKKNNSKTGCNKIFLNGLKIKKNLKPIFPKNPEF